MLNQRKIPEEILRLHKLYESIEPDDNDDELKRGDPYRLCGDAYKNPFCIIPGTKNGCYINTPCEVFKGFFPVATYVFAVPVNKLFSHLVIYMRRKQALAEGWGAIITCYPNRRTVMGESYGLGYIEPRKLIALIEMLLLDLEVTKVMIYVTITTQDDLEGYKAEYKLGRIQEGPFIRLN